jgi:hypothetical protein
MAIPNPVAFKPFSVTFWTTLVYLAIFIPLIIVNETVPPPPSSPTLYAGINLTEAWADLTTLTRAYHPYNSRNNDQVRDWLLRRLQDIFETNGANDSQVVVFNDIDNNVTVWAPESVAKFKGDLAPPKAVGTYFEGSNIAVYIRGKDDPKGEWWQDGSPRTDKIIGKGGVLVNAHFDSVSTGFGATDDGMGCITVLQLVKYFTSNGNQPQRGIVALLNNNEEDWLWGSTVFGNTPLMPFCHTFVNLEGAGAGGRADVFRATDADIMKAYGTSKHPSANIVSSDLWDAGAIRSGTDYETFAKVYGMRGLDMAFYRPRARYHTSQDDTRHASRASLWHMLSNALETTKSLSGDTGNTFVGERPDGDRQKVANGRSSKGVWFDIFGEGFAVFELRSLFAWSLSLLIASPLILVIITFLLVRHDKYYLFASRKVAYEASAPEPVMLGGMRGLFRFPIALTFAVALLVGSAFLLAKINPLVIYSSPYTVWAMMVSLFYFAFWTIMAGANFVRPSALHRCYVILWLFVVCWVILVVNTVFEDRFQKGAGYVFVFLHSAVFLAAVISLSELFAVPTKADFAQRQHDDHEIREHLNAVPPPEAAVVSPTEGVAEDGEDEDEDEPATENTPLVRSRSREHRTSTTFKTTYRRSIAVIKGQMESEEESKSKPFGDEQQWSTRLPSWLWILQFLLIGPFIVILFGQTGLLLVSAVNQTGADGGSLLLPYSLVAFFSIALLLPLTPFIHRVTHHVPVVLLVAFGATLIYNLTVFPFDAENRYKMYFQQTIDLDTAQSNVSYRGVEEYVRSAISELPSAMGKQVDCVSNIPDRPDLVLCSYEGSAVLPNIAKDTSSGIPPEIDLSSLVSLNVTREGTSKKATFHLDAVDTRTCGVEFASPITSFHVHGAGARDDRFKEVPEGGLNSLVLYRVNWDEPWVVDIDWTDEDSEGLDGSVYCNWDDVNTPGTIPAFDEGLQYLPDWVALTKQTKGLLKGRRGFLA